MVAGKRSPFCLGVFLVFILAPQNNAQLYPTLARIALDILPSQASSVPCEHLFSGTKQVATDRRASLGSVVFEELTIMKSAWGSKVYDTAAWNSSQAETCIIDFEHLLVEDGDLEDWEKDIGSDSSDFGDSYLE